MDRSRPSPSCPRLPVCGSVQSDLPIRPDWTEPYRGPGSSGLVESLVLCVAFSPDGQPQASGSCDSTVKLWDLSTGASHSTLEGHSGFVNAVAFSPDGLLLASALSNNSVKLWDPSSVVSRYNLGPDCYGIKAVAFSPDGQLLASTLGNIVTLWETSTGASYGTLKGHSFDINAVALSPDGQFRASASRDKTVMLCVGTGFVDTRR